jgi:predicted RNA-binding Zn ribbon-like protein
MAAEPGVQNRFDLDTGNLCLDFANTLEGRYDDPPRELITGYDDLLLFAQESETLDDRAAAQLRAEANRRPAEAIGMHAAAIELREAIFGIFAAIADGHAPSDADLATLNQNLARSLPHGRVARNGDSYDWQWEDDPATLARPLWPVAYAAMQLLLDGPVDRIRECAAHDCGWLFIDTTRNRARRWCSMKSCGNRAKVAHFRERQGAGHRTPDSAPSS